MGIMIRKVVHVIGHKTWKAEQKFLGSTKDIVGRRDYFDMRSIECVELAVKWRSDEVCLEMLKDIDLSDVDAVIMEHPRYPKSLAWLKREHPHIKRMIRGHNAEFIHQLHFAWAYYDCGFSVPVWRRKRAWAQFLEAFRRLRLDFACARLSDHVLSISDWESRNYWPLMASRQAIATVPYFLPHGYLVEPLPKDEREKRCLCMMSSDWNPMAHHAAKNFVALVNGSPEGAFGDWEFLVTGALKYEKSLVTEPSVKMAGLVDDPFQLVRRSHAMALLSNLGMGFKTKILEVLHCGNWVLMPKKLYDRQPPEVRPGCIVVDPRSAESFATALEQALHPMPALDANEQLRHRAFAALDRIFGYADAPAVETRGRQ